jgi:hypothetical protein
MNRILIVVIVLLGLLLPGVIYYSYHKSADPAVAEVVKTETFNVLTATIISGHEFDLKLEDGRRVRACLSISSAPEAKRQVIRLLHDAKTCQVTIKHTKTGATADILLNQETSLTTWLKTNKMAFDHQCQPPPVITAA